MTSLHLTDLPSEVLHRILVFLDVPSLLQVSRTSHSLRVLSSDPLLQRARLHQVRHDLPLLLSHRPPRASISPPNAWIWMSKTNVLSRSISKSLIRIRLNHSLGRRPGVEELVERAILPEYCFGMYNHGVSPLIVTRQEEVRKSRLRDKLGNLLEKRPSMKRIVELNIIPAECAAGGIVSPKLAETRRQVVKEHLKDGLRAWVKGHAIQEQRKKEEEYDGVNGEVCVKDIVRRFSAWNKAAEVEARETGRVHVEKKRAQVRWGKDLKIERMKEQKRLSACGAYSQPTRAHVLGLRRFWEGVVRTATR